MPGMQVTWVDVTRAVKRALQDDQIEVHSLEPRVDGYVRVTVYVPRAVMQAAWTGTVRATWPPMWVQW